MTLSRYFSLRNGISAFRAGSFIHRVQENAIFIKREKKGTRFAKELNCQACWCKPQANQI